MAINEDVINEIKYRNDIETTISQYVNLKRRGKNLVGLLHRVRKASCGAFGSFLTARRV